MIQGPYSLSKFGKRLQKDWLCLKIIFRTQEKSEQLEHKLEMRRKQFHVLISSIHSLQGMLDEGDEEVMDVSLENGNTGNTDMQILRDNS